MEEGNPYFVLTDTGTYTEKPYKNEQELERLVVSHAKEVFGKDSIYFDVKQKVTSKLRPRITDGYLLAFDNVGHPRFWVVEYELSSHDLERDVAPQLRGFVKALQNEQTIAEIRDAIYHQVKSSPETLRRFKELATGEDLYFVINKALHEQPGVLVVFDWVDTEIRNWLGEEDLPPETLLIEFQTFEKDGKLIHRVNPLLPREQSRKTDREPGKRGRADYEKDWDVRITWVDPPTRELAEKLIQRLNRELHGVRHRPRFRWHSFYQREPFVRKNDVATILVGRRTVSLWIRTNPEKFSDPDKLSRPMAGFFYPRGTERRVKVTSENFEAVVKLAKSAYEGLA